MREANKYSFERIYLCGPTVYDELHIGNLRPIIVFDFLIRSYKQLDIPFYFVSNITDIDDKIIAQAIKEKTTEREIAKKYITHYRRLLKTLDIIKPNTTVKVSTSINGIKNFINKQITNGYAYESNGDVYFDISKYKNYGHISKQVLQKMIGEDNNTNKHNQHDFALWKKTTEGQKWDSPWSKGRPGWHTECAYFVWRIFKGEQLNIHGGGIDLKFPHHENENAQFWAVTNQTITSKWIHVGHLMTENLKMSKSLGNVFKARDFINKYGVNTTRMIFLLTNPFLPMNISDKLIDDANKAVQKLRPFSKFLPLNQTEYNYKEFNEFVNLIKNFEYAKALAYIHENIRNYNKNHDENSALILKQVIIFLNLKYETEKISKEDKKLLNKWSELRKENKFKEADLLRKTLQKKQLI